MNPSTPYVVVELEKVEESIKKMVNRLNNEGIQHRPHIKPHKSIELAKLQINLGAKGIACATLSEAEVMAEGGIDDILIAFPIVGKENLERFYHLSKRAKIITIVDSDVVAKGLSEVGERLNRKVEVLIELDGGIHRGGVQPDQEALDFAKDISQLPGINIVGLFTYLGQIYNQPSLKNIEAMAREESKLLLNTRQLLEAHGFHIRVLSGGSTPSSFFAEQLHGITESRAGNYIFYDMNAVQLGLVEPRECALKIYSTIVSTPLPGYATIDAGSKTLTSDKSYKGDTYGYVLGKPGVRIEKLNEEHGFLRFDPNKYTFTVGEKIEIVPNHSCVIPNLNDHILGFRNGVMERKITIDARGKNY